MPHREKEKNNTKLRQRLGAPFATVQSGERPLCLVELDFEWEGKCDLAVGLLVNFPIAQYPRKSPHAPSTKRCQRHSSNERETDE
jgi:hypothetical protein